MAKRGVEFKDLKINLDDRGYLYEAIRCDDPLFEGKFGHVLVSVLFPGVVKAWHRHHKQIDYTFVVKGNIKYGIVDESAQKPVPEYFFLGEQNPKLIKVPSEIWHGYTAIGSEPAIVVHVNDVTFDPADTDKLDPREFGAKWEPASG
ncbi:MAG: hypothetical protein A2583_07455 [Bdellovibrionales bacterium RIFOXYD1_FULL_53_11]|nr:MAG: hypothetical protein A2583_07455 [Bdellovibrionales bacterium RIFOXYD1_FULL_53_11]